MKGDQMSPEQVPLHVVWSDWEPIAECWGVFASRREAVAAVLASRRVDLRIESIEAIAAELAAEEACRVP